MIKLKFCKWYDWNNLEIIELETYKEFFDFYIENADKGCIFDVKIFRRRIEMNNIRKVEVLKDDTFTEIQFSQLKNGDVFKLFEPTGEPVFNEAGTVFHKALSDPFKEDGVWMIEAAPLTLVAKSK